jgi:hypothetical protein
MPAPTAEAAPIRNTVWELCVAKAVAKMGASVETEPSIRPASPGCTMRSTKLRSLCMIAPNSDRPGSLSDIRLRKYHQQDTSRVSRYPAAL